ncbi:MAG TPA: hypothetical protein VFC80_03550 [Sphaerochaeta sp.]|nr:hypothetical protein [Sphaerochaeta sp.]
MKRTLLLLLLLLIGTLLFSSPITFHGGRTTVIGESGSELITLTEGASIAFDAITLNAEEITLSGEEYRSVVGVGEVSLIDTESDLSVFSASLFYDRITQELDIIGFVQVDDRTNGVQLSAFRLYYNLDSEMLEAEASVLLLRHTDVGVMVCQSEQLIFDRKKQELILRGKPTVEWDGNRYAAEYIRVNLATEEITMRGAITGVIGD